MRLWALWTGALAAAVAGCARGPDAVIPPPWHPASVAAPAAPPIEPPEILDETASAPAPVRIEPSPSTQKPSGAPAAKPGEGGHGAH